ncbi:3-hydroxyacyl-CoA dehydrogenase [Halomonas elongata]|uniref:3-hydroxyacyl-CoA dehydrogenase n=1 Tax=Halomonas elongata (strain ATCC 33173 / DSM 2581 / NBRC 15536 / NCIMB 2198 / 1H9) TaxID=768066 RepID=E1V600_HALED|nr:3-hydroxyacyl-CoA dehydrogenase [Halomonas elongata]WBF16910.1 3-hydroxyacyl-CoA dehydrogenase [Halomonas elongata]WPU45741.1 3-hydroxyacyl-CoA dehydrogenase [Halomonas elongata DSM 2581]CBV43170.1 3-hydroxyacyl-CoA dehydrogenase domain protein [Halomonas elongata DSM 2581]
MTTRIGILGAGLIGRAWAIVFARAGMPVTLYDVDDDALDTAREAIRQSLTNLQLAGLIEDAEPPLALIRTENDLARAMADTAYIQECGPENVEAKRRIYTDLETVAAKDTVLASSTSGIAASQFTEHLHHPERCLVVHPVNPPYLIPLVEVAPSPLTWKTVVDRTMHLMEQVQQAPILVRKEIQGFILNRLQGALLNEALRLFRDGYVSAEDLDKTVKHGLGLRWSFMGPLETIDLNAPGGVVDYGQRYAPLYHDIDHQRGDDEPWAPATLAALDEERREQLPTADLADRQAWRDRRLMALIAHQRSFSIS